MRAAATEARRRGKLFSVRERALGFAPIPPPFGTMHAEVSENAEHVAHQVKRRLGLGPAAPTRPERPETRLGLTYWLAIVVSLILLAAQFRSGPRWIDVVMAPWTWAQDWLEAAVPPLARLSSDDAIALTTMLIAALGLWAASRRRRDREELQPVPWRGVIVATAVAAGLLSGWLHILLEQRIQEQARKRALPPVIAALAKDDACHREALAELSARKHGGDLTSLLVASRSFLDCVSRLGISYEEMSKSSRFGASRKATETRRQWLVRIGADNETQIMERLHGWLDPWTRLISHVLPPSIARHAVDALPALTILFGFAAMRWVLPLHFAPRMFLSFVWTIAGACILTFLVWLVVLTRSS